MTEPFDAIETTRELLAEVRTAHLDLRRQLTVAQERIAELEGICAAHDALRESLESQWGRLMKLARKERDGLEETVAKIREYEGGLRLSYNDRLNCRYHEDVVIEIADELEELLIPPSASASRT